MIKYKDTKINRTVIPSPSNMTARGADLVKEE